MKLNIPSPLEQIKLPEFTNAEIEVYIKRDDLINSEISGNKWRKLNLNISSNPNCKTLLTFGGAFSNHIAATAATGKSFGISTIGIIRGEELDINSNQTLKRAAENGMELIFVSRAEYKRRYDADYWTELRLKLGEILIIEEGGANNLGALGCAEILDEVYQEIDTVDYMITAAGTGTTAAGLLYQSNNTNIIAVPVFKNGDFIKNDVKSRLNNLGANVEDKMNFLTLETRFHFGGYGKFNHNLISFINVFYNRTNLKLDQIYTGKMVYAFMKMVEEGKFKKGSKIVLLHTGGLQGLTSIKDLIIFD